MDESKIKPLEGLEGIYDLILAGEDQKEPDLDSLILESIETRYESKQLIGEGGMKEIYENFDSYCQRSVARAELKQDSETKNSFLNEARILSRLEHSNIVPLYDIGYEEDGRPFFIMRLLKGQNLQEIINGLKRENRDYIKEYTTPVLLDIFLKVCDAISYAHSQGVIHLDIKPANIQIDQYGEVLVCDWGLAKIESDEDREKENIIKGSPGYMAPEQVNKKFAAKTKQTDIYSLGALLYSILTYLPAIEYTEKEELLIKTLSGDITSPRDRCPERQISSSLDAVTMKAMNLEPEYRYQSTEELSAEIRAYQHGFATEAEDADFWVIASLLIKRYKVVAVSICLFLLILSVTVSFFLIRLNKEKRLVSQALTKSQESEKLAIEQKKIAVEQKTLAVMSQKQAKESEEEALDLLNKLRKKTDEHSRLIKTSAPKLLKHGFTQLYQSRFENSDFISRYTIGISPENKKARILYTYNQFGLLRFDKVLETFKGMKLDKSLKWIQEKALLYSEKEMNIEQVLQLIKFIHTLPHNYRQNMHSYIIDTVTKTYSLEDRLYFARKILQHVPTSNFEMKKIDSAYSVSIKNNYNISSILALQNIPLVELDISNTLIHDFSPLRKIPLRKLNISNTRIDHLHMLNVSALEYIDLKGTNVVHLGFLENSKIRFLRLSSFPATLFHLVDCKFLETLVIPKGVYENNQLKVLRDLKVKIIYE